MNELEKELEFEKYIKDLEEKIQDPNYDEGVKFSLPENPTPTEEIKFDLCQKILSYQQDSNLDIKRTREILYSHSNKFTLDDLFTYADKLFAPAKREKETILVTKINQLININEWVQKIFSR